MKQQLTHLRNSWAVNPVKYDPDWYCFARDSEDVTHPVMDWVEEYFGQEVQGFIQVPPETDEEGVNMVLYLFDIFARFFVNLGWALKGLVEVEKLNIEVALGSMLTFCSKNDFLYRRP